jgi:hypothetical protein
MVAALVAPTIVTGSPAAAATYTKVVRYGPFTIPAATDTGPGMIHNSLSFFVSKPCVDCYVTSFTPDLVYPDGSRATMDNGAMLHHAMFTSQFRSAATCRSTLLGLVGERFFASGNERTAIAFRDGYGYRIRWYDAWDLLVDLMNMTMEAKTVYVQVTYTYRPSWEAVKPLKPVWLDVDECGDSEYATPAGPSDTHWDWTVNVPGTLMAMIGHLHGHGVRIEATDESQGGLSPCSSVATLDRMDVHTVLSMSTCVGSPLGRLHPGDSVRLHSIYDTPPTTSWASCSAT